MKTSVLLIVLNFFVSSLFSQQSMEWIKTLENPEFPMFDELKPQNKLSNYYQYDFSGVMNPNSEFLGYIGEFRRIKFNYNSIHKSEKTPNLYFVNGNSLVSSNRCDFEGTITIEQIREFKNMYYGIDNMYSDSGLISQGVAIGKYVFSENPEQEHVGVFQGIMTLWWYLDKDSNIQYYDLNKQSDRYKNNQYIGTWTEYGKSNSKVCNWGEYRIPFSGDLDFGSAEFSVNPKYYNLGWKESKK